MINIRCNTVTVLALKCWSGVKLWSWVWSLKYSVNKWQNALSFPA